MENTKYLIIGGGVAGTTAAENIRQQDAGGSIVIVSDEPYALYSRIMLSKPNFFLEKIPFDQIWLKHDDWYREKNIALLKGRKAVRFDTEKKVMALDDGTEFGYEKLLLAIGGCPRPWDIPGSDKKGVFSLRTLDDAKAIMALVKSAKRAVAVGGGFISFEMCEMLRMVGIVVTLVLRESYFWEPLLDEASGRMIEDALKSGGVEILYQSEVAEVSGNESVSGVTLKDGRKIECEMVIAGIGVFCPLDWLKTAGVAVNKGILANEYLETNIPSVWAAGDAAEFQDLILGEQIQLGNWVNAQMHGRRAGLNMAGQKEPFRMVSFYTTQGFGVTIGFVGDVRPGPDRTVVQRGSRDVGSYARLLVKDNELIGGTMVNRTQELGAITKLIEKDITVSEHMRELADPAFDLKTFL